MADKNYTYPSELYQSKIYKVWSNMKTRCNNPNSTNFHFWGGRGISYDKKWDKFCGFYEDMKDDYRDNLSLDRIDNNKGYFKENCRWTTQREQSNNTRQNRIIDFKNKRKTIPQWSRELNIKRSTIAQRYYVYGWDIAKCLSTK